MHSSRTIGERFSTSPAIENGRRERYFGKPDADADIELQMPSTRVNPPAAVSGKGPRPLLMDTRLGSLGMIYDEEPSMMGLHREAHGG